MPVSITYHKHRSTVAIYCGNHVQPFQTRPTMFRKAGREVTGSRCASGSASRSKTFQRLATIATRRAIALSLGDGSDDAQTAVAPKQNRA